MTGPFEEIAWEDDAAAAEQTGQTGQTGQRRGLPGALGASWRWFRAFRRTRPFWGGLWTMLAGVWIIRQMDFGLGLAVTGGWSYSAGYTLGGALVLFGLAAWFTPHYRGLLGPLAFLAALIAFVAANLGGYLVGTLLGIVGGSMIWAWGDKKPRGRRSKGTSGEAPSHG